MNVFEIAICRPATLSRLDGVGKYQPSLQLHKWEAGAIIPSGTHLPAQEVYAVTLQLRLERLVKTRRSNQRCFLFEKEFPRIQISRTYASEEARLNSAIYFPFVLTGFINLAQTICRNSLCISNSFFPSGLEATLNVLFIKFAEAK